MRVMDENFMDALSLASFAIGMANYEENLTQSDKDDLMSKLDEQTKDVLGRIHQELEDQNVILRDISDKIDEILRVVKEENHGIQENGRGNDGRGDRK